ARARARRLPRGRGRASGVLAGDRRRKGRRAMKVGAKRMKLVWRVIAVDGEGYGHGDCGHNHRTASAAVACKWAPPGWDDILVCDLLVRQVRDPRIDSPRALARRRAA